MDAAKTIHIQAKGLVISGIWFKKFIVDIVLVPIFLKSSF